MGPRSLLACATLCLAPAVATCMERLTDASLAKVQGRDGMSFNLSNFAMSGNAQLRYSTADNAASFSIGNLAASRSDNLATPFIDPYRLDVIKGDGIHADYVNLALPQNAGGQEVWQFAYDFGVNANGVDAKGGSVLLKDLTYFGGGWQWSTPLAGDGLAFGYALRSDLGSLTLRPNGRDMPDEQMILSGVHVSAAGSNAPWRIADVNTQAGIFNARTDASGQSSLHIGIDWPDASGAAIGAVQIANISFTSSASGMPVTTDLGASRIGGIQIQYLDIKFRP